MSKTTDWMPTDRTSQLVMAKEWKTVLDTRGGEWGVPPATVQEFDAKIQAADAALAASQNESTRTPVTNALCATAFGELTEIMRRIKRKYFTEPELTPADLASLGLRVRDKHPTKTGDPTAQVTLRTFLSGRHEIGFIIEYITGSPDESANKGYRVWYSVVPPGQGLPPDPEELRKSFFTKRKKDILKLDFAASGSTLVMAVQVENDGKKGPWGPLVSALIP